MSDKNGMRIITRGNKNIPTSKGGFTLKQNSGKPKQPKRRKK